MIHDFYQLVNLSLPTPQPNKSRHHHEPEKVSAEGPGYRLYTENTNQGRPIRAYCKFDAGQEIWFRIHQDQMQQCTHDEYLRGWNMV